MTLGGQRPPHPFCSRPRGGAGGDSPGCPGPSPHPTAGPPVGVTVGDPGRRGALCGDAWTRRSPARSGASRPGRGRGRASSARAGTRVPLRSPGPLCARPLRLTASWKTSTGHDLQEPGKGTSAPQGSPRVATEAGPGKRGLRPPRLGASRRGGRVRAPRLGGPSPAALPVSRGPRRRGKVRRTPTARDPPLRRRIPGLFRPSHQARPASSALPQSQGRLEEIQAGVSIRPLPRRRAPGSHR